MKLPNRRFTRKKVIIFVLFLIGAILLYVYRDQTETPQQNWNRIVVSQSFGSFSFLAPPDVDGGPVQGIDSSVSEYANWRISLSSDIGWYSVPLERNTKMAHYKETQLNISGRPAQLVEFENDEHDWFSGRYVASIHIPEAISKRVHITMWANCTDKTAQEIATKILQTITIHKE